MSKDSFVFGIHPVMEAIESGTTIQKVWLSREHNADETKGLKKKCKEAGIFIQRVPREKVDSLVQGNHQGVVASVSPIDLADAFEVVESALSSHSAPVFLILDGVTDTRNVGAIIRSAECFGASAVIMPTRGSANITSEMVKTSAGAVFNIPVCKEPHFGSFLSWLTEQRVKLIGCTEKGDISLNEISFGGPTALILGDEGAGLHEKTLEKIDIHSTIPMTGKTGSLNVSVAAGVLLYEVMSQKNKS